MHTTGQLRRLVIGHSGGWPNTPNACLQLAASCTGLRNLQLLQLSTFWGKASDVELAAALSRLPHLEVRLLQNPP